MSTVKGDKKEECPHCGSDRLKCMNNNIVCLECGTTVLSDVNLSKKEEIYSHEDFVKKSKHAKAGVNTETDTQLRNFRTAMANIGELVNKFHLPPFIKRRATNYYKRVMNIKPPRKDALQSLVPALVYLACRKSNVPLSFKQVDEFSDVKGSKISDAYFKVREMLEIDVESQSLRQLVLRFSKKIGLRGSMMSHTNKLINKIEEQHIGLGKDPVGTAAAVVYLAAKQANKDITQYDMTKIATVSEVTIKDRVESIRRIF